MNDIIIPTKKLINDTIGSAFIPTSWIKIQNSFHRIFALPVKNLAMLRHISPTE